MSELSSDDWPNPYQALEPVAPEQRSWWRRAWATLRDLAATVDHFPGVASLREFRRGRPFLFDGLFLIVDSAEQETVQLVIGLGVESSESTTMPLPEPKIHQCEKEVIRVLHLFRDQHPQLFQMIEDREGVFRCIGSYQDLSSDRCEPRSLGRVGALLEAESSAGIDETNE